MELIFGLIALVILVVLVILITAAFFFFGIIGAILKFFKELLSNANS